ncbi:MAG: hypothetical protein GF414_01545 [Candidatus Altiarchaeales archaeon]|nr:hypothetical protein [Candidatus Altiarchaeales archaeon]
MPAQRCSKGGRQGWRWGDKGVCYVGPDAKERAIKVGYAIGLAEGKRRRVKDPEEFARRYVEHEY